jgi:hypothetical protein
MRRLYTYDGQGISTKLRSNQDGKKYIISTAPNPGRGWQLAVFRCSFCGRVNILKPLRVENSATFQEAEERHLQVEELVINSPIDEWGHDFL